MLTSPLLESSDDDKEPRCDGRLDELKHDWQKHGMQYVQTGHRVNFIDQKTAIKSVCMCHNETVNLWTHLLGAIVYGSLIFITLANYNSSYTYAPWTYWKWVGSDVP